METSNCKWSMCIGRILLGVFFVALGAVHLHNWDAAVALMTAQHVPSPSVVLIVCTVIEILFGALLALGWLRCLSSIILILFVLFVTFYMFDFWTMVAGPARHMVMMHFLWNVGIIGGLFCAGSVRGCCKKEGSCSTNN